MYALIAAALAVLLVPGLLASRRDPLKLRMVLGLLLCISLLLIGMNVQARWLFFLASVLFAAVVLSYLLARLSLCGLEVTRRPPLEVTEGEAAPVSLAVRNPGRLPRRLFLLVDEGWREPGRGAARRGAGGSLRNRVERRLLHLAGQDPEAGGSPVGGPVPIDHPVRVFFPRLEPAGRSELRVPRLFPARGVYSGGRVTLQSGGWLGLASSRRSVAAPAPVTVLPRYVELDRFPALDDSPAARRARSQERPDRLGADFYGTREYRPGDPLRHVHWRSTARTGRLVVREFEREPGSLLEILVVNPAGWDAGPWGDTLLDSAARIAASLLFYAARAQRPGSLAFARGSVLVQPGPDGFAACRAALASLTDDGGLSPEEMARRAAEGLPPGSTLVVVLPSYRCDLGALAGTAPGRTRMGLVLLDAASFGAGLDGPDLFSPEELEGWGTAPPPGFSFCLNFKKGDDLEACLEAPLPIISA